MTQQIPLDASNKAGHEASAGLIEVLPDVGTSG